MSIIRIGLAETKKFGAGYEAIFGKTKKETAEVKAVKKPAARAAKKKPKRK